MGSNSLDTRIEGEIRGNDVRIGVGAVLEKGALIIADKITLGDFCFIGAGTKIIVPTFSIGDYTKLHARSFCHGELPLHIGSNCWIGGGVVLDSMGGLTIKNGVGIGSGSQLWTHIKFGDTVQGCRFHSKQGMTVGEDAWFVGHCLVSPVVVGDKSMAMLGSVVTRDMEPNHVYAGVPATDITAKVGPQFEEITLKEKHRRFAKMLDEFYRRHPEHSSWVPQCDLEKRTYVKTWSIAEVEFFKENVPLVKLYPEG